MREIIELIIITFLPFLELRASIPYGILKLVQPGVSSIKIELVGHTLIEAVCCFLYLTVEF